MHFRPGKLKARDYLRAWVQHLAWGAVAEMRGEPAEVTTLIGEDETVQLALPSTVIDEPSAARGECQEQLRQLLHLYWRGLHEPLPFFPESALAYVSAKTPEQGSEKANHAWKGSTEHRGDREDSAVALCFPTGKLPAAPFAELAGVIFAPLLAAIKKPGKK